MPENDIPIEEMVHYFHALDCGESKHYGLVVAFPEGKLHWCDPNVNCCKKIKKVWNELPTTFKDFLKWVESDLEHSKGGK